MLLRRLVIVILASLAFTAPAAAQDMSSNVQQLAVLPELKTAISINFIGDVMFASTVTGLYSYDISDPASPKLLGALPGPIWENEDMDVDVKRKRVFLSREPRGFTTTATAGETFPYGAVHVIDVSDPRLMRQVGFFLLPAGHTTSCVNDCDFVWSAGPRANPQTQPGWRGRPVFATDVTDPADPKPCPAPIDTERNDGVTDYAHDVQVDSRGIAWVSGAGGIRGYWTSGEHLNPLTGNVETATACSPIPYAGSGSPTTSTISRFMHNSWREPDGTWQTGDVPAERVLYATEENITSNCTSAGRFVTYDLDGTFDGEGWRDIATTKHRMKGLDWWTPRGAEGSSGCASAHYFASRGDGVFANSFMEQGVRFLDVSDPRDIRQIGWWRPPAIRTWAPYWRAGHVYVADYELGLVVLKFTGSRRSRTLRGPRLPAVPPVSGLRFSRKHFSGLCPLPR